MDLRPDEITGIIKNQIRNFSSRIENTDVGTVVTVGDGIARIHGLDDCMSGELLEFEGGIYAMAMNLEQDFVAAVMLGSDSEIKEGDTVKRTGNVVSVPVGEELLGRVVNSLGQPIDGKGPVTAKDRMPIEQPAYGIITRKSVSRPLQTGSRLQRTAYRLSGNNAVSRLFDRHPVLCGHRTLSVDRLTERVYNSSEKLLAYGNGNDISRSLYGIALFDLRIGTQHNRCDEILFEVHGHCVNAALKFKKLAGHTVVKSVYSRNTVTHRYDGADIGIFDP